MIAKRFDNHTVVFVNGWYKAEGDLIYEEVMNHKVYIWTMNYDCDMCQ